MVVLDTSVWIEYLKRPDSVPGREARHLLVTDQALLAGPVLAELLRGTRSIGEADALQSVLDAVPFVAGDRSTWAQTGQLAAELQRRGEALPLVDVHIAAIAIEHGASVYSLDRDFERIPGLSRYQPQRGRDSA